MLFVARRSFTVKSPRHRKSREEKGGEAPHPRRRSPADKEEAEGLQPRGPPGRHPSQRLQLTSASVWPSWGFNIVTLLVSPLFFLPFPRSWTSCQLCTPPSCTLACLLMVFLSTLGWRQDLNCVGAVVGKPRGSRAGPRQPALTAALHKLGAPGPATLTCPGHRRRGARRRGPRDLCHGGGHRSRCR